MPKKRLPNANGLGIKSIIVTHMAGYNIAQTTNHSGEIYCGKYARQLSDKQVPDAECECGKGRLSRAEIEEMGTIWWLCVVEKRLG